MSFPLRYATANQPVPLGRFVGVADGDTEQLLLTINAADIQLWKTGTVVLVPKNSGGATHMARGIYVATMDATDTNTYGPLFIFIHVSGALDVKLECCVYPALYYDATYLGTEFLPVDALKLNWSAPGSTLTVKKPDGTTTAYTKPLATNALAEPIVGSG